MPSYCVPARAVEPRKPLYFATLIARGPAYAQAPDSGLVIKKISADFSWRAEGKKEGGEREKKKGKRKEKEKERKKESGFATGSPHQLARRRRHDERDRRLACLGAEPCVLLTTTRQRHRSRTVRTFPYRGRSAPAVVTRDGSCVELSTAPLRPHERAGKGKERGAAPAPVLGD